MTVTASALTDKPHVLVVQPWIYDFAAYDFWARPMGLMMLAAILRRHDYLVSYADCLDRFHPRAVPSDPLARYGRGPYLKTPITKPEGLADVQRVYSRYGIRRRWLWDDLQQLSRPDIILVTSMMTYWYPGVQATIKVLKTVYPRVPIVLGGIYATLCTGHAMAHLKADRVVAGPAEEEILPVVDGLTGFSSRRRFDPQDPDSYPFPAFDLQRVVNFVPLLTVRGCPFRCAYCAGHQLFKGLQRRQPDAVVDEMIYWHLKFGVRDFVFYDDALLVNADQHLMPLLERVLAAGYPFRFHTPNAIHISRLTPELARLMYRAGFKTLRLGLETMDFDARSELDRKVTARQFTLAVGWLKGAGFSKQQIGAYLLVGLPGQPMASILSSIKMVKQAGVTPVPAYYTPIPGTALWPKAVKASRYDLASDPILTNNALMPCRKAPFAWSDLSAVKENAHSG